MLVCQMFVSPRHLHTMGMLVRDLKPDNVVLSDEGQWFSGASAGIHGKRYAKICQDQRKIISRSDIQNHFNHFNHFNCRIVALGDQLFGLRRFLNQSKVGSYSANMRISIWVSGYHGVNWISNWNTGLKLMTTKKSGRRLQFLLGFLHLWIFASLPP